MSINFHAPSRISRAFLVLFIGVLLIAAATAVVTAVPWQSVLSANDAPPNGTTVSAPPGTMGLARPHPPMPTR